MGSLGGVGKDREGRWWREAVHPIPSQVPGGFPRTGLSIQSVPLPHLLPPVLSPSPLMYWHLLPLSSSWTSSRQSSSFLPLHPSVFGYACADLANDERGARLVPWWLRLASFIKNLTSFTNILVSFGGGFQVWKTNDETFAGRVKDLQGKKLQIPCHFSHGTSVSPFSFSQSQIASKQEFNTSVVTVLCANTRSKGWSSHDALAICKDMAIYDKNEDYSKLASHVLT